MATTKIIEIFFIVIFVVITNSAYIVAADEELKFDANVDDFIISSRNDNDIGSDSDNINDFDNRTDNSKYNDCNFSNIVNNSTIKKVNKNDDITIVDERQKDIENSQGGERILRRGKRYLDFVHGTRVSWRTTVKNNILKVNTLWGYGFGFRSNFPFPDKADRLRPFFKRDLLHATIDMLDRHGLDGRACILKSYCMARLDGESPIGGGMIFKFLKMLLSLDHHERRHFPYLHMENCKQILHSHCPLSFNSISPFTDDV